MTNFSAEELLNEATFRRWQKDEIAFMREVWKIKHPERGAIPFELRPEQYKILKVWNEDRFSISLKARQIGWSTLVAAHSFWLTFFHRDRDILILSSGEREAAELLGYAWFGYDLLPQWLIDRGPKLKSRAVETMAWNNASSIVSLPSKKNPARGKTGYLTVVDEWAFLENPEGAWSAIAPTADVGGRIIGISTANGAGDFFHSFWLDAVKGVNGFTPMFFPWHVVPERDEAWYEAQKTKFLDWQLHQEYPSDPDEAFIKSGNPVFDTDMLIGLREKAQPPRRGSLWREGGNFYRFAPDEQGSLRLWEMPERRARYVIGADVAMGLEHGDYSCAHVINVRTGKVAAVWHGHLDADLWGQRLAELGYFYNRALVGVEANSFGLSTCHAIRRLKYPMIYYRHTLKTGRKGEPPQKEIGWITNLSTKPVMVSELNETLRDGTMTLLDESTVAEMLTFVRDENGKMSGSPHDDLVMSLAIANQMRAHSSAATYEYEKNPEWTVDWWFEQLKPSQDNTRLGRWNIRS